MDLIEVEFPGQTEVTFTLTIQAHDGQFVSTEVLFLTITNLRQPPNIINLPGSITVYENAPGDTELYKVVARGADPPSLRYSLTAINPVSKRSKFSIHHTS